MSAPLLITHLQEDETGPIVCGSRSLLSVCAFLHVSFTFSLTSPLCVLHCQVNKHHDNGVCMSCSWVKVSRESRAGYWGKLETWSAIPGQTVPSLGRHILPRKEKLIHPLTSTLSISLLFSSPYLPLHAHTNHLSCYKPFPPLKDDKAMNTSKTDVSGHTVCS